MVEANLPLGPFFLDDLAHQQLLSFAKGRPKKNVPKFVTLVGPIKGGKSAVLMDVLPGMIATNHAAAGGLKPVFFRFSFNLTQPPKEAARHLLLAAAALANNLGFVLDVPATIEDCLLTLSDVMGRFAKGIADGGGELCMLLDEVQVSHSCACNPRLATTPFPLLTFPAVSWLQAPVLSAETPTEATSFATALKEVFVECHPLARIAVTGSGMVTLLNTLRRVKVNGHSLWSMMTPVLLGATL